MRRRVLNLVTFFSLLLFVKACVLWIRSDDYEETFEWAVPASAAPYPGPRWHGYRGGLIRAEGGHLTVALGQRWASADSALPCPVSKYMS